MEVLEMRQRNTTYKCLYCNARYNREDLVDHIADSHYDNIPEGYTPLRVVFNYVNKKPMTYSGKCTECGGPTKWDEDKGRYDRQCEKKACHDSYVRKFEQNMLKTRGVTRVSATKEGLAQMLANRKISGKYRFQDGGEKSYVGSYEKNALEFMDKVLNLKSDDIMCPGPILEYSYQGETHIYITDFYYQPYNLIIEVKDGGDNPNKRNMPEYRAKQVAKEQFIIKHTNYNYLRLTDNNFEQLINTLAKLKMQMVENTGDRVIDINESNSSLHELMTMAGYAPMVGIEDSDAYIVNYMQNNVFSGREDELKKLADRNGRLLKRDPKYGVSNSIKFNSVFARNERSGILELEDTSNITIAEVYKLDKNISEVSDILRPYIGKEVSENFIYESLVDDESKLTKVPSYQKILEQDRNMLYNFIFQDKMDRIMHEMESLVSEELYNDYDREIMARQVMNSSTNISLVFPSDTLEGARKRFDLYCSLSDSSKNLSNGYSMQFFGKDVPTMFEYIKNKWENDNHPDAIDSVQFVDESSHYWRTEDVLGDMKADNITYKDPNIVVITHNSLYGNRFEDLFMRYNLLNDKYRKLSNSISISLYNLDVPAMYNKIKNIKDANDIESNSDASNIRVESESVFDILSKAEKAYVIREMYL